MIEEVPEREILPLIVAPVAVMVPIVALLCALIIFVLAEVVLPLDNSICSIELLPPLSLIKSFPVADISFVLTIFFKLLFASNFNTSVAVDVIVPLLTTASTLAPSAKITRFTPPELCLIIPLFVIVAALASSDILMISPRSRPPPPPFTAVIVTLFSIVKFPAFVPLKTSYILS